jgi:hypothetical protein
VYDDGPSVSESDPDYPQTEVISLPSDTVPVRAGEELNVGALAEYLRGKLEGVEGGITVGQFPGGHSNLTYLLRGHRNELGRWRAGL